MYTHALSFIQDLAVIMLIAGIITVIFHRLKQPVVLGYIIAGIIIGPYTPPFLFIQDINTVKILAELGVIFLMFSLGLEFDLHKLKRVGAGAFIAALGEILLMIWLGYKIGLLFGWPPTDAIFLGAILAISSTTIIVKALEELGLKKEGFAQFIFGILIIEDIFAIAILTVLSGIAITGAFQIKDIFITAIKLSSFLAISLVLGILLIPRILAYIAKFKNKEMLLISVLGFCFGFCLLVAKLDYSIALGAFLIGAIIAESRQLHLIENLITPLRDMFSAIFFVSVGLLFNPQVLIDYPVPIIVITIAVVVGKVLTCSFGAFLTGNDTKTSIRVGMGLAQIGEFSFIIAALGITLNVTSHFLFPIAVAVSAITTFLTPYLIRYSDSITNGIYKVIPTPMSRFLNSYTRRIQRSQNKKSNTQIKKIIHRNILQIIINLLIVIAIFFSGAYISQTYIGDFITNITNIHIQKTVIWASALIISLPFLSVIYKKTKNLSLILVESSLFKLLSKKIKRNIRKTIPEIIPVIVLIGILLFVSALSSTILPPTELLIIVSLTIFVLVIWLYSWFIRLHSKLHTKLLESMKKNNSNKKF